MRCHCASCLSRFALGMAILLGMALPGRSEVVVSQTANGMMVKIDGSLFTEYLTRSGAKPILWPIIGPSGKPVTRAYPMGDVAGETKDHIHQRSLWFTHGDVNGVSFWHENANHGTIVHRQFSEVRSGPEAGFVTDNDWIGPDGKKLLTDQRRLRFGGEGNARWIDFDITLKATAGPVKLGDTKEGTFGVRVAETMRVDAKLGGRIVNSEGKINQDAWGRQAAWVDYHGPVGGQVVGIAIMNHPKSFRFPTHWHVRTYGLFAANPFGIHEFPGGENKDGSYVIEAGQSITLRYRVWIHRGDEKEGRVASAFEAYAKRE
jgi:hypothetical protein